MPEKERKKHLSAAVIGAGFSGLVAAVYMKTAMPLLDVTLYEGKPAEGKKILVTGNGRCNLTNRDISPAFYHGETELFSSVYAGADNKALLSFFSSLGVVCRGDFAGRYYPVSNSAVSVRDALLTEVSRLGIKTVTDCKIQSVSRQGAKFLLNGTISCDLLLFACGGKAAPVHGSDGSGYDLLQKLGVEITPLCPCLVPLYSAGFPKSLKGVRAQGTVTVKCGGDILASDTGEIQYTDYGLSGIPSFQVSAAASRALARGRKLTAVVDSAPFFSREELSAHIHTAAEKYSFAPAENILGGIMPKKLAAYLLSSCSLNPAKPASSVSYGAAEKLVNAVKGKKYEITSVGPFADAQVTAGGIPACELDENTLALKKLPGAFACGEIIDVDGLCGGYNLQWAFSSAVRAADGLVKEARHAENQ